MLVFWSLAALMTLVALAFVLVPLLRSRPATGPSNREANLEVLRGQRREIEADVANGILPADKKDEALAELVERAHDDLSSAPPAADRAGKPWVTATLVAIAVPLVAFGVYLVRGTPAAVDSQVAKFGTKPPVSDKQIVAMVETLAQKVRERPDDIQGWSLLARSMATLQRFPEAAEAYARLNTLTPNDPDILADYADVLGMAQGGTLAGKPYELVKQALALDPSHKKSLALAGTAALDARDFDSAARYWQALARALPPDSEDAGQVRAILAEVMTKAAAAGQVLGKTPSEAQAPAAGAAPRAAATNATSVSGSVSVAPEIAARVDKAATLFIFARAENGPRMPLAIVRSSAAQLPAAFTLDDSQAMAPNMKLSSVKAVRIEARVSRSGQAAPQPGDLVGTSPVVQPGARDVKIILDKVLP
jgi:cytochrome c-type biogenesis protein CcmH